jgi:hypothetical protein
VEHCRRKLVRIPTGPADENDIVRRNVAAAEDDHRDAVGGGHLVDKCYRNWNPPGHLLLTME